MKSMFEAFALSGRPALVNGAVRGLLACAMALAACSPEAGVEPARPRDATEWPSYGGDPGGQRFASQDEITRENVGRLEIAWTFHTGDFSDGTGEIQSGSAFEATPILVDGLLYVCSPFNRVFALDPQTGAQLWGFDPEIDLTGRYANQLVCRGVEYWRDVSAPKGAACTRRIFTATNDARLFAIDAETGRACSDFGAGGQVDLNPAAGDQLWRGEYQVTSPPAVLQDRVIVGSAVGDNARIDAPSGVVRAFDARSGRELWAWDLAPPGFEPTPDNTSAAGHALGTPNVWAPMAVDPERDLVFVPTGNAAPDYYRGRLAYMNHYGSSVVALRGSSGEIVWHFQTVHNDLWDYDVPAQPTLTHLRREGVEIPVVVQATKMGLLFVLHRENGEPVIPVEERPVPQDGAPGEVLSPTQPFPVRPPPLVPHTLSPEQGWGFTPWDRARCRERLASLHYDGIYTPPGLQGTLSYPGNGGGSNWGGVAVHPERQLVVANVNDFPFGVQLVPRGDFEAAQRGEAGHEFDPHVGELAPQRGTPYALRRFRVFSPFGAPCNPPPWGTLAAVDLTLGEIVWQVPLGTLRDLTPLPLMIGLGVPNLGGPIVTSSGLVFIAAAVDDYLRAFDLSTGEELWRGRLPAGGQATPMMYRIGSQPYVVIAAGGHARAGSRLGDALVAFTLGD
jgi:quinoprotein glucose dehydrogenase